VGIVASESTTRLIRGTGLSTEGVESSEDFIRFIRCQNTLAKWFWGKKKDL
jgi:hypothetical protein